MADRGPKGTRFVLVEPIEVFNIEHPPPCPWDQRRTCSAASYRACTAEADKQAANRQQQASSDWRYCRRTLVSRERWFSLKVGHMFIASEKIPPPRLGGGCISPWRSRHGRSGDQGSRIETGGGRSIMPLAIAASRSGLNFTLLRASSRQKPLWDANHLSIDGRYFS